MIENTHPVPKELLDYLETMILPPEGRILLIEDSFTTDWVSIPDASLHGLIIMGQDKEEWDESTLEHVWRILKPGAHVMLIAPDNEPAGFTGACAFEERGFQVRDAITVLDTAGEAYYVPKATRKERNAGVPEFETRTEVELGFPTVTAGELFVLQVELEDLGIDREIVEKIDEEGLEWGEIPEHLKVYFEARMVERVSVARNSHTTVKPIAIMEALMADLPPGSTIADPFLGSGTTGCAALKHGMNFIGIEQDMEHLRIADARIHHTDRVSASWNAADIESDVVVEEPETPKSLMEFFGCG